MIAQIRPIQNFLTPDSSGTRERPSSRICSLDGLRAISILLVVIGHTSRTLTMMPLGMVLVLKMLAHLGVTVFFAISGFLITTLLVREYETNGTINKTSFYLRRIVRIVPAAMLFISIVIAIGRPTLIQTLLALTFTTNLAFTKAFKPLQHLWSLAVEEQFYLAWPLAFSFGLTTAKRWAWIAALVAPTLRLLFPHHDVFHKMPFVADSLAYGCIVGLYYDRIRVFVATRLSSTPIFAGLVAAAVVCAWFGFDGVLVAWVAVPPLTALVMVIAIERRDHILNWKPLTIIGTMSYSLYLWQQPFMTLPGPLDILPIRIALSFVTAYASYRLVEQPILRRFGPRWAFRRRKRMAQGS